MRILDKRHNSIITEGSIVKAEDWFDMIRVVLDTGYFIEIEYSEYEQIKEGESEKTNTD